MIDILKIKQFQQGTNPKSIKIQSIRKGIVMTIKEKLQENKLLRDRLAEVENKLVREKENKAISSIVYNGIGSGSSAKKQHPSMSSTVTLTKTQRRENKSYSLKQDESGMNIKNRLNTTTQYSQQKLQKKGLRIGDSVRTLMDNNNNGTNNNNNNEQMSYNIREKMRVKEIITNSGKYYKNLQ